ncbi:Peptidyl-prolyl cis-trans isomerase FKBP65 [Sesbania bispinosa]|nr:Peptidyl-prolyl cis-trans isomerase FKBP65 [Sesbania bispinosa]
MKHDLKTRQSFQNLMGWNSLSKRVFLSYFGQGCENNGEGRESSLQCEATICIPESGRPTSRDVGVVPPNASLQIYLELVSWKTPYLILPRIEGSEEDLEGRRRIGTTK